MFPSLAKDLKEQRISWSETFLNTISSPRRDVLRFVVRDRYSNRPVDKRHQDDPLDLCPGY